MVIARGCSHNGIMKMGM